LYTATAPSSQFVSVDVAVGNSYETGLVELRIENNTDTPLIKIEIWNNESWVKTKDMKMFGVLVSEQRAKRVSHNLCMWLTTNPLLLSTQAPEVNVTIGQDNADPSLPDVNFEARIPFFITLKDIVADVYRATIMRSDIWVKWSGIDDEEDGEGESGDASGDEGAKRYFDSDDSAHLVFAISADSTFVPGGEHVRCEELEFAAFIDNDYEHVKNKKVLLGKPHYSEHKSYDVFMNMTGCGETMKKSNFYLTTYDNGTNTHNDSYAITEMFDRGMFDLMEKVSGMSHMVDFLDLVVDTEGLMAMSDASGSECAEKKCLNGYR